MKKYISIITLVLLTGSILYLTGINSINENEVKGNLKTEEVKNVIDKKSESENCCKEMKSGEYSDESVYLLNGKWTDQDNEKIKLGKFKNKNVVLAMFFASCRSACPVIVNNMRSIESSIPEKLKNNFRFVLVSIDPENDTPSILSKYATERNLDTSRWTLLTGSKDNIMELSMLLGFNFIKNENGGFTHTNLISFLNKEGEVVCQNKGLSLGKNTVPKALAMLNN